MPSSTNDLHIDHWEHFFSDEVRAKLYPTWWDVSTANHWRHERLLEGPLKILSDEEFKSLSWLLVGDGSGHDTWILRSNGFKDLLTTDIGVGALDRTLKEGHINRYEQANAENLQYSDNSFDIVLCKEALHHMQRPYAAIYEMIRVARQAVVIIEPQCKYIDLPCMSAPMSPNYESVGNFVYSFSKLEFTKLAYGLNLEGLATKNIIDVYIEGCEFHKAEESDPVFLQMKGMVENAERLASEGKVKWNYILSILFKNIGPSDRFSRVRGKLEDFKWDFLETNTNPYLS